ncbi:MAG: hypothetical protein ABIA04_14390 [Pseudomonadota bacterium]
MKRYLLIMVFAIFSFISCINSSIENDANYYNDNSYQREDSKEQAQVHQDEEITENELIIHKSKDIENNILTKFLADWDKHFNEVESSDTETSDNNPKNIFGNEIIIIRSCLEELEKQLIASINKEENQKIEDSKIEIKINTDGFIDTYSYFNENNMLIAQIQLSDTEAKELAVKINMKLYNNLFEEKFSFIDKIDFVLNSSEDYSSKYLISCSEGDGYKSTIELKSHTDTLLQGSLILKNNLDNEDPFTGFKDFSNLKVIALDFEEDQIAYMEAIVENKYFNSINPENLWYDYNIISYFIDNSVYNICNNPELLGFLKTNCQFDNNGNFNMISTWKELFVALNEKCAINKNKINNLEEGICNLLDMESYIGKAICSKNMEVIENCPEKLQLVIDEAKSSLKNLL